MLFFRPHLSFLEGWQNCEKRLLASHVCVPAWMSVCLCLRQSVLLSICMEELDSIGGIFMNIIFDHFSKTVEKIQVSLKSKKNDSTLQEDQDKLMIISRWIIVKMRNIADKFVQKIKTYILCSIIVFSDNCSVYEIMWKHSLELDRPKMAA